MRTRLVRILIFVFVLVQIPVALYEFVLLKMPRPPAPAPHAEYDAPPLLRMMSAIVALQSDPRLCLTLAQDRKVLELVAPLRLPPEGAGGGADEQAHRELTRRIEKGLTNLLTPAQSAAVRELCKKPPAAGENLTMEKLDRLCTILDYKITRGIEGPVHARLEVRAVKVIPEG